MSDSTFNILSFDGGGIRGALSIKLLEKIQNETPNIVKKSNMISGTSTGSLIALGLAYGMTPSEIEDAVRSGLVRLGRMKEEVDIEILEEPKSGFFGFGSKPARVRITEKAVIPLETVIRSEERRVGKECRIGCRSRWSPYH